MGFGFYRQNSMFTRGLGGTLTVSRTPLQAGRGVTDLQSKDQTKYFKDTDWRVWNNAMNTLTASTSTTGIMNNIRTYYTNQGATGNPKCWAAPIYGSMAESMGSSAYGTGDVSTNGEFNRDAFTNATNSHNIKGSAFEGLTRDCLWFAMSYFTTTGGFYQNYLGTVFLNFRHLPATGSNGLKEIFHPADSKHYVEALVMHGNRSSRTNDTIDIYSEAGMQFAFSSLANSGSSGFYNNSQFSQNDGIWGIRTGNRIVGGASIDTDSLDASASSKTNGDYSYGIQNKNSTDSSANVIHWHDTEFTNETTYKVVCWTVFN
jgi:hypothetical protein